MRFFLLVGLSLGIALSAVSARGESSFIASACASASSDGKVLYEGVPLSLANWTEDEKLALLFELEKLNPPIVAQWEARDPKASTFTPGRGAPRRLTGLGSFVGLWRWPTSSGPLVFIKVPGKETYRTIPLADLTLIQTRPSSGMVVIPEDPDYHALMKFRRSPHDIDWNSVGVDDAIDILADDFSPIQDVLADIFSANGRAVLRKLDAVGLRGKWLEIFVRSYPDLASMKKDVSMASDVGKLRDNVFPPLR